jgi:hypothetical protein
MRRVLLAAVIVCIVGSGCSSKIAGETNEGPPPGGPKASERRPPGESEVFINQDK